MPRTRIYLFIYLREFLVSGPVDAMMMNIICISTLVIIVTAGGWRSANDLFKITILFRVIYYMLVWSRAGHLPAKFRSHDLTRCWLM